VSRLSRKTQQAIGDVKPCVHHSFLPLPPVPRVSQSVPSRVPLKCSILTCARKVYRSRPRCGGCW
jgi:hypothetical protein